MVVLDAEVKDKALEAVKILSRFGTVRAVYLFGSQVDGTADEWSDIDVAIFMDDVENWDIQRNTRAMVMVMEEVGDDVEAHIFPASSLEHPGRGSFVEYILGHGVRVETENGL